MKTPVFLILLFSVVAASVAFTGRADTVHKEADNFLSVLKPGQQASIQASPGTFTIYILNEDELRAIAERDGTTEKIVSVGPDYVVYERRDGSWQGRIPLHSIGSIGRQLPAAEAAD